MARVPVYGKIRFRDRDGMDAQEGINVGDEWTYRGYVEGASPASLIWTFEDVREEMAFHFVSHMDQVLSRALVGGQDADVAAPAGGAEARLDVPPVAH